MTNDHVRAFVDRIIRLKDEIRDLNVDVREIYAEAKAAGYDKTVLGKVVNYIEKRTANGEQVAESDALFDLYLGAYDGKSGMGVATHTHEAARQRSGSDAASRPPGASESLNPPAGDGTEEVRQPIQPLPAIPPCEPDGAQGKHASDPEAQKSDAAATSAEAEAGDSPTCHNGKSEEAVTLSGAQSSPDSANLPEAENASGPSSEAPAQSDPIVTPAREPSSAEVSTEAEEGTQSKGVRTAGKSSGKRSGGDRLPVPSPNSHRLGSFSREARFDELAAKFRRDKVNPSANVSTENQNENVPRTETAQ